MAKEDLIKIFLNNSLTSRAAAAPKIAPTWANTNYRQLLLFLAVLIVPVITIAVQGRRIWTQEQELSSERADEIREQMALDIGQEIVTRLERIKTQEMANKPSAAPRQERYSDPAVVA